MTRAEARDYFHEKGLTYADISHTDLVYLRALLDIDEAVGSRIIEMAGGNSFNIAKERSHNYRLKGVTVL